MAAQLPRPPGLKPAPRSAGRRDRLLDQIVEHLVAVGIADLSLRPLAQALGTSTYSLSYHFGSKDGLVHAAVIELERRQLASVDAALRGAPAGGLEEVLVAIWGAIVANLPTERVLLELAMSRSSELPDALRARLSGAWVAAIGAMFEARGMPRASAVVEATILNALFVGLEVDLMNTGDHARAVAAVRAYGARTHRDWVSRAKAG